jgi:4-hydroxybutyrate CoA-transferase
MTVFVEANAAEPLALTAALEREPDASGGVTYAASLITGINRFDYAGLHADARLTTFFLGAELRSSFEAGRIRLLPLNYSEQYRWFETVCPVDLAFVQVTPPDEAGRCSLGIVADFVPAIAGKARAVVAEVNRQMPRIPGAPSIPFERLDHYVETDRPLITVRPDRNAPGIDALAANAASLIRDGDTLQTGIGRVQDAILTKLADRKDLGFHSGLLGEAALDLVRRGVLTGARKTRDPGRIVTGSVVGSQTLYDLLPTVDRLEIHPACHTHSPAFIAGIDNFVSINSAIEVDLLGQINCETARGRQVSGIGGLGDFIRGARLSAGGRSILAFGAATADGRLSRIVTRLGEGNVASAARSDIDYVVTEHGIAALRHLSVDERAEALISVAAPAFQATLWESWRKMRSDM